MPRQSTLGAIFIHSLSLHGHTLISECPSSVEGVVHELLFVVGRSD